METDTSDKKKQERRIFTNMVLSWSTGDVLNMDLYNGKVGRIPMKFLSTSHYMNSFIFPLQEETRADLKSKLISISHAPTRKIDSLDHSAGQFKLPNDFFYDISLMKLEDAAEDEGFYEPMVGDLIALTDVRPKHIGDLCTPHCPYAVAVVQTSDDQSFKILSSSQVFFEKDKNGNAKKGSRIFAVYLANLTTNIRIWQALNSDADGKNMGIIRKVLHFDSTVNETCSICNDTEICGESESNLRKNLCDFKLNDSQKAAVLNCIAAKNCHHQRTVKLIWGPPGTGKTKTVSSLLFPLLKMKCRTLICAPTNIAVLEVAQRLMSLVSNSLEYDNYGLGDIVLFGNRKRMKIDDRNNLHNVFLDDRVKSLSSCLNFETGWKSSLESMICLLEDCEGIYDLYLRLREGERLRKTREEEMRKKKLEEERLRKEKEEENLRWNTRNSEANDDQEDENPEYGKCYLYLKAERLKEKQEVNNHLSKIKRNTEMDDFQLKEGENSENDVFDDQDLEINLGCTMKRRVVHTVIENEDDKKKKNVENNGEVGDEKNHDLTFEEFVTEGFSIFRRRLINFMSKLWTHLPTSFISTEVVKKMIRVHSLLSAEDVRNGMMHFSTLRTCGECLQILRNLVNTFSIPEFVMEGIEGFCLSNSCLVFCTASSSVQMLTETMNPLELLVIDEAALLKECESAIPLQLPGLQHAILVGDEKQLPAMVQSKNCENADFGRSLFERLVILEHQTHLLNVQYRMHPSISQFPNRQFYDTKILNGQNVLERSYERRFLNGSMYGPYSFIDISQGKEELDNKNSTRNMMEVAVVADIISRLFEECVLKNEKVSVGCISPYKAQVLAIQQKLGNKYQKARNFSVSVRTIDGFQGGEEDVIIFSTVRCNMDGEVGFLSSYNRTNVALTRARYCLWILGSGSTLEKSRSVWNGSVWKHSVWKELVLDAKARGCFYKANDDKNLAQAIVDALTECCQLDSIFCMDYLLFKELKWKVCFTDELLRSIARTRDVEIHKKVISLLVKLSSGWRLPRENGILDDTDIDERCCQLLEIYTIERNLYLLWSVDILVENSVCIQVIKVWYIAPLFKKKELTKNLSRVYGNYTVDRINRCKTKHVEENLVLPMKWPMNSDSDSRWRSVSSQLSRLGLQNEPSSSSTSFRHDRKSNKYRGNSYRKMEDRW